MTIIDHKTWLISFLNFSFHIFYWCIVVVHDNDLLLHTCTQYNNVIRLLSFPSTYPLPPPPLLSF